MIEKMKFLTLTGPENDLDRVVSTYLTKYEIHLENALTELADVETLMPFQESNPYRDELQQVKKYTDLLPSDAKGKREHCELSELPGILSALESHLTESAARKKELEDKKAGIEKNMKMLEPFRDLPVDLASVSRYRFLDLRFGRIPRDYYGKFKSYVYDNFNTIFYKCHMDESCVYGVYYAPRKEIHRIDAVYSSMHFERIHLPSEYTGTPAQIYHTLAGEAEETGREIARVSSSMQRITAEDAPKLLDAEETLTRLTDNFEIRKYAALMQEKNDVYYILCGWMRAADLEAFQAEIRGDSRVDCVAEDPDATRSTPPTVLKNPAVFRPYEMYVEMYGLPNYREMDPTIFVALSYSFIFGAMYGDWGQGLCLLIGGFLLYHFRHVRLAGIISFAGIFSTFFGIMFGSFFGFEDTIIRHVWLKPKDDMVTLPGIGSINTVLAAAIVFGMFMILTTMIFSIINSHRLGDKESELFGTNSLIGFIFYAAVIYCVFTLFGSGHGSVAAWIIAVFIVLPLVAMFCKEPLTKLVTKDHTKSATGPVMFIVQNFFEMFETLLSFFSNTLSFVRVGAFAVSHAAMMEVVMMLAGGTAHPNWGIVIGGNLFVMGMEGLIVGIQVLRLEYYEMFSRFYHGDGKAFRPFRAAEASGALSGKTAGKAA